MPFSCIETLLFLMPNRKIPKTGWAGLSAHYKEDLLAGFNVSLISLPLSLGIAMASGLPPLAGLITVIVGGLVASRLAGTYITISGPSAGLIVVTLAAVENLGGAGEQTGYAGYSHAMGAICIASLIMILLGLLRVGKIGDFFPKPVVRGMLSAIGLIIIIKQIYPALGMLAPNEHLFATLFGVFSALPEANTAAVVVSMSTLAVFILHPLLPFRAVQILPPAIWMLIVSIPLAAYYGSESGLQFVDLPQELFGEGGLTLPSFQKIAEDGFWVAVLAITLLSSLETLISAKAVDNLDPYKRQSDLNQDLVAQGSGSVVSGAIGGLPMISAIVRSTVNVNNGGKTQWSNFFQGVFMLLYLLIASPLIELIPEAALAGMLLFTGFRLARPAIFKSLAKIGPWELSAFSATLLAILSTNLLVGIGLGIVFQVFLLPIRGVAWQDLFRCRVEQLETELVRPQSALVFSNFLSLKKQLDNQIEEQALLKVDLSQVPFIDYSVMQQLQDYKRQWARKGKDIEWKGLNKLQALGSHPLSPRRAA